MLKRVNDVPSCWFLPFLLLSSLSCAPAPAATATTQGPSAGEALTTFLVEAHAGRFDVAASSLTLDFVPEAQRATEGPRLARRLMFLLDRHLVVEAAPPAAAEAAVVTVGALPLGRFKIPVELVSFPRAGQPAWSFSARTVRSIDALFAEHGSPLWEVLPQFLVSRTLWVLGAWQWLGLILLMALAWGLARLVLAGLTPLLARISRLTTTTLDDQLVVQLGRPARALFFLLGMALGTRALVFPLAAQSLADAMTRSAVVAALAWALLVVSRVVAGSLQAGASRDRDANSAGAVKTRVSVLHRLTDAVVLVVGVALILLQFPGVRSIGMSVLASAGVVGVVIGLAAQRTISNLLAGIQISITQPIRLGDTVVIDKQFGVVEEIHLTFVVIKAWDLRRVVVPVGTLLDKPFENWSRLSTELLGTVELYADCSVDVEAARAELLRLAEGSRGKLWDGKKQALQVTDMSERSVTLRALVSAEDADRLWDLRCLVREHMVAWLHQQPGALPRVRTEATA
ncbi:MAG: mechanosensitive ion channel [Archangium sp.]|nr:mechanosensitive ion channel [Archangium sp.]